MTPSTRSADAIPVSRVFGSKLLGTSAGCTPFRNAYVCSCCLFAEVELFDQPTETDRINQLTKSTKPNRTKPTYQSINQSTNQITGPNSSNALEKNCSEFAYDKLCGNVGKKSFILTLHTPRHYPPTAASTSGGCLARPLSTSTTTSPSSRGSQTTPSFASPWDLSPPPCPSPSRSPARLGILSMRGWWPGLSLRSPARKAGGP